MGDITMFKLLLEGGIGIAVVVVLMLKGRETRGFLSFLSSERDARDKEREAERADRTKERESLVGAIEDMTCEIRKSRTELRDIRSAIEHCPTNGRHKVGKK